jgi:uncharacterized peroxidase-related enzyme
MAAWVHVVHESEAAGELREVYERVRSSRGKVSNIMRVQSLNPRAMQAHLDLYLALLFDRSGLSRAERELIAVTVSALNGCEYCVSHHAAALNVYWRDEQKLARLVDDYRQVELSPRERAMVGYAVLLTREPAAVSHEHVAAMRAAGLSEEEVLSVNLITSYFNFVNRVANGLGVESAEEEVEGYRY